MKPIQEARFEYKGIHCVVLFQPMGFRCGYVGLSKENKYYGVNYNSIPVDCHCGLTYSNSRLALQEDTDKWWIGFDCGHCCDAYDVEKMREYYASDEEMQVQLIHMHDYYNLCSNNPIRTLEYCATECRKIVDQIVGGE